MNKNEIITLDNNHAQCQISLFGGQVLSYRPKGQTHDVFWLGNLNKFDASSAIRGGIPVCWPRFAAEELNAHLPRHGFARISNWQLQHFDTNENQTEVVLHLPLDKKYNTLLSATLSIKITDQFECCLETTNHGSQEFKFSEALHAYFNVGNRDTTILKGFNNCRYKSSLDQQIYTQKGDLMITDEFDAAFLDHHNHIEIIDKAFNRVITLEKSGSDTTIVWNSGKDLAEMSPDQYKNFICVEPANQGASFITLAPLQKHRLSMIVRVNSLNF